MGYDLLEPGMCLAWCPAGLGLWGAGHGAAAMLLADERERSFPSSHIHEFRGFWDVCMKEVILDA